MKGDKAGVLGGQVESLVIGKDQNPDLQYNNII